MYLFSMLMSVPVLINGENSIGNNNYEQLAQLNSQIESKHMGESTNLGNTFWQADFGKCKKTHLGRGIY